MKINPTIKLCLHHIKDLQRYLLQLENIKTLNGKLYGVMFYHPSDPMPADPAKISVENETKIYMQFKDQYYLYRSKKAVFSHVPDSVASAARLSYYHCIHEIDPEKALFWLLQAFEKRGIIEYQLTRSKREEHGSAYRSRPKETTSQSKQIVLFALHAFTPHKASMSRAKIIEECIPEFEKIANSCKINFSCEMDSIYENVCVWIHRDNEFKVYFNELETAIKKGLSPESIGIPNPKMKIFESAPENHINDSEIEE